MRTSEAALAVIRGRGDGEPRWLTCWNKKWQAFHLIGGHRVEGESFRNCLIRELFEELGLREGSGYEIDAERYAIYEYRAWSASAGVETSYTIALFLVDLIDGVKRFQSAVEIRWLSATEIRRGCCDCGLPISPTMAFLLENAGIL